MVVVVVVVVVVCVCARARVVVAVVCVCVCVCVLVSRPASRHRSPDPALRGAAVPRRLGRRRADRFHRVHVGDGAKE